MEGLTGHAPRYNIAPGQNVITVRLPGSDDARIWEHRRWGLVPHWAKDARIGNRMINARSETLAEKPAFRVPLRRQRCLVPADGFYEWAAGPGAKQPYLIARQASRLFAFAGLWEHWEGKDGEVVASCTLVTTAANDRLRSIHHRMPVILPREDYAAWLDPAVQRSEAIVALLRACPDDWLETHPVATRVNDVRNDDSDCVERTPEPLTLF